jgi:hypothetical protein
MNMTVLGIDLTNHSHSRLEPCRLFPRWATAGSLSGLHLHVDLTQVISRAKQTRGRMPK